MRRTGKNLDRSAGGTVNVRSAYSRFRRMGIVWFITLGLLTGCGAQNYAQPASVCEAPTQADELSEQLLRLINMERTLADLDSIEWDEGLAGVARGYACRMIEGRFFGHIDPQTKTGPNHRLTIAGYEFNVMGENLAVGQTTAVEVLDGWMASPSHRDNILSPEWTRIGIGVRTNENGILHWVLEFADPA